LKIASDVSFYYFEKLSNITPQVEQARDQSQIFNRKSISRNTTHRQSHHPIQIQFEKLNCKVFIKHAYFGMNIF